MIKYIFLVSIFSANAYALGPCNQDSTAFCSGQGYAYCYESAGNDCCSNVANDPGCAEASQVYEVTRRTRMMVPREIPAKLPAMRPIRSK